jgi:hypothetical protein
MKSEEEITKRDLTREEIAAMYVFHSEYALQTCGAIEFWRLLAGYRKRVVVELLQQLDKAGNPVQAREPHEADETEIPYASER